MIKEIKKNQIYTVDFFGNFVYILLRKDLQMRDEKQIEGYKNGVNYHRPLFKFKRIVIKSIKNLVRNMQQRKTNLYWLL